MTDGAEANFLIHFIQRLDPQWKHFLLAEPFPKKLLKARLL